MGWNGAIQEGTRTIWSKELMLQMKPWVAILCSYMAMSAPVGRAEYKEKSASLSNHPKSRGLCAIELWHSPRVAGVSFWNMMLFVGRLPSNTFDLTRNELLACAPSSCLTSASDLPKARALIDFF